MRVRSDEGKSIIRVGFLKNQSSKWVFIKIKHWGGFSIKINHRVGQPIVGFSINGDVAGGERERGGMHQRWDFL